MSKFLALLALLLTITVAGYGLDTLKLKPTVRVNKPLAYVQAGYLSESWSISNNRSGTYVSAPYYGQGVFVGVGALRFFSKVNGYATSLSADYLTYGMRKSLAEIEGVGTSYSFFRVSSGHYLVLTPEAPIKLHVAANLHYLASLGNTYTGYFQFGLSAGARYKAFGASLGYNTNGGNSMAIQDRGKVTERQLYLQLVVYPAQLERWREFKALFQVSKKELPATQQK